MICVYKQSDIPKCKHWAIIKFGTIITPGRDLRDPAERVPHLSYMAFTDEQEWRDKLLELATATGYKEPYQALVVEVPTIKINVQVEVQ